MEYREVNYRCRCCLHSFGDPDGLRGSYFTAWLELIKGHLIAHGLKADETDVMLHANLVVQYR